MSTNKTIVNAEPAAVWAVLSDPHTYAHWVVGASETRFVEGDWPAEGSTFHHTQMVPKVGIKDSTSVLTCLPLQRLEMCVRIRPFVVGVVDMRLRTVDGGTEVTMHEKAVGGIAGRVNNPLFDAAFFVRNIETLRRLKKLAEREGAVAAAPAAA